MVILASEPDPMLKIKIIKENNLLIKVGQYFFERFKEFLKLKNDFENPVIEMFEEVVHSFGKSDGNIYWKNVISCPT